MHATQTGRIGDGLDIEREDRRHVVAAMAVNTTQPGKTPVDR